MDSIWYEILVVTLGSLLAILLILAIIIAVIVIKIARVAKRITQHAEQMADRADHMSAFFQQTATPLALFKLISNIADVIGKKGKKK
jgi:hypothetical protein